jgi:O-antigen/teichoic acid export membrane protein
MNNSTIPDEHTQPKLTGLARNSVWNVAGWICSLFISLFSVAVQIRVLGKPNYGLLVLLNTVISPLGVLDFGMAESTIKFLAERRVPGESARPEKLLQQALLINLSLGFLGAVVLTSLSHFLAFSVFNLTESERPLAQYCFYWIALSWIGIQLRQVLSGAIAAKQKYRLLNLCTLITQIATTLISLLALLIRQKVQDVVIAQSMAIFLSALVWYCVVKHDFPELKLHFIFDREIFLKTRHFNFWQTLNNLGGWLSHESQRWLLGILLPVASVGLYNLGLQLTNSIYLVGYRIGQVLLPETSRLHSVGNRREAAQLMLHSTWLISLLTLAGIVPLVFLAPEIVQILAGREFSLQAIQITQIISIGVGVGCLFIAPSFFLLGISKPQWLAVLSISQGILTFTASAWLIPLCGLSGAGWGLTIGTLMQAVILVMIWRKFFRGWTTFIVYFSSVYAPFLTALGMSLLLFFFRQFFTIHFSVIVTILLGILVGITSLTILLATSLFLPGGQEKITLLRRFIKFAKPFILEVKYHRP